MGYSAMRTLDPMIRAILATGGLTKRRDPVLIPTSSAAPTTSPRAPPTFLLRLRRAEGARGRRHRRGIRALEIPESGMAAAKRSCRRLSHAGGSNPFFVGVEKRWRSIAGTT